MADLIQEFNNLGGKSTSDHKKNFFLYTNKLIALDEATRLHVLNNLRAEQRQEEIFLTRLLLKFKQIDKIKQLVLQGDRILNKLVTHSTPFIFKDENVNYFMSELFPNVSYIVRNKCLHNLSRTITRDDVGEEFFKQVLTRYGIKTALILIQVCNQTFIKEILTHYRVVLRERQLIILHQRFGYEFIKFYYAECSKYGLTDQFEHQPCFASYLSTKDITTFYQLLKYGKPKLGKKGFNNFMSIKKDEFLTEPMKYSSFDKPKILYRLLNKEEFRVYFLNKLPKKVSDFNVYSMQKDIQRINIKDRGTFLSDIFKEKYGCNFFSHYSNKIDNMENIDSRLNSLLSPEDMLKFDLDEEESLEFLHPDKSFPLIKERIDLTADMNNRCTLIMKLFRSARNNNDNEALKGALKYVNQRHKNDQSSIREDVFNYIRENYKLDKFGDDIWEYLHELILAEQMLSQYELSMREMLEELMYYKFAKGDDITSDLKKLVKKCGHWYLHLPPKNKDLQRWILKHLPDICKEVFVDEDAAKKWPNTFLSTIRTWNKSHPKEMISYFDYPDIIEAAISELGNYYWEDLFPNAILIYKTNDPEIIKMKNEIIDQHISKFASNDALWNRFLKSRVDLVEKHIDVFFEKCCSVYKVDKFLYELNKMHYTSLPGLVREKSLKILKDSIAAVETKDEKNIKASERHLALKFLSYGKDFMQIISNDRFYPSGEAEINVLDESFKDTLLLREQVVECLRNRPCPQEVMPVLLRFCFKDYFKCALPVLTNVLYNLPEKDVVESLKILQDRSVSVRKRALFFATSLQTAQASCDALRYAGENEKNTSLQKFVFNRTFKNYCNVGDVESWKILMENFKFVFEKDYETHIMVYQFNLIPRTYLACYFEKVWNDVGKKWHNQHARVLNAINADIMTLLSDELCDDIIQFNLLHSTEQLVSSDVDFIYTYLLSSGDKINHRFDLVASNARVVADEDSQLDFKEFNRKSRNISFLYKDLCRRLMTKDGEELKDIAEKKMLVNKLAEAFPNLPLPYNHLDYQIQIEVCRCYLNDETKIPELFIKLQKDVLEKHGDIMMEYFNELADALMSLLTYEEEYRISFVQKMLECEDSTMVKLMAIKLLPGSYPSSEVCALKFRRLIEKIEADAAPVVGLYLNRFLKDLSI